MTSTNQNNQQNINLSSNMSWKVRMNLESLERIAGQVKGAEPTKYASVIISLYEKRQIPKSRTAEKVLYELRDAEPKKLKFAIKHAKKILARYQDEKPITHRLKVKTDMKIANGQPVRRRLREKTSVTRKKQIVGEKIVKLFRNRLTFQISEETAFKKNVKTITLEPKSVGAVPASSLDVFAARSYLIARKRIPKDAHFGLYASCSLEIVQTGKIIHITSEKSNSKELSKFFEDFVNRIEKAVQSDETVKIKKFEYNFVIIPQGSGRATSRDEDAILNKTSVIKIVNDDNNCFWYALACLMNPKNREIRGGRNSKARTKAANLICNKSKLPWDQPMPLHFIALVEETYNININVIDKQNIPMLGGNVNLFNCLMYKSENRNREHHFLLYDDIAQHYDCITDIKKFLAVRCFCHKCFKGFTHQKDYDNHECDTTILKKKVVDKRTEFKMLKEISHYLSRGFTKGSKEEIETYKGEKGRDNVLKPRYIIYDFETDTHDGIHKPNHVEVDILNIDDELTHEYDSCLIKSFGINGYNCEAKFCDWLFTEENSNSTVIAHNGAGYDNKFVLQYCLSKGIVPSAFIRQGSRITYMSFKRYHIRFIDSYHFFIQPLKKLSATYDIDTLKGHFPHRFNIPQNQNYIGKIPDEDEFGVKNMMPEDYDKDFKPWYDKQKHITDWSFKTELVKYCRADVELLSKTVLKYRKMFKDNLDTDPFRYTTLASLCMSIYLNKFIPEKKIVGNGVAKQDSIVGREWLNYLNDSNICREVPIYVKKDDTCDIHKNKVGDEPIEYYNLKRPFTVDGYDKRNKKVSLFQGCYWHGCRKCHPENEIKYNKTMEQVNLLEHNGYVVEQMWECEWKKIKETLEDKAEIEQHARQQNIKIRDAFVGGRTEGFKSYHKCGKGQQIFYFDVVSLYPAVNALDEYAVGFNRYVKTSAADIKSGKFFGVAKVDVTPPKDLYIPVLPDNSEGKLLFHLNKMVNKTFSSVELKYALEKGYTIDKIHSALQFSKHTGLMKDYVEFFLKMKIENNKFYTPEECERINKSHNDLGFTFEIKSENTRENPGMKQLAKICLNSLWGKFGQRSTLDSYEYVNEWNRLLLNLTNNKIKTNSWHIINDSCVELRYTEDMDYHIEAEYISEITAVFTAANARIRLISMLHWLDPTQLIYCDTDSVIFLFDENNPNHKYPSNDTKDKPPNVSFGEALGEFEDELKGGWIEEIVVAGAKSYGYRTNKNKIVIKAKGITLDRANSSIFTFENMRDMVLKNVQLETEKRFQFIWSKEKNIETRFISRTAKQTIDTKRTLLSDYYTVPFGYQSN